MSVHVLYDPEARKSCLMSSTTGEVFGVAFPNNTAEDFVEWLAPTDARELSPQELADAMTAWADEYCASTASDAS
jgi:hypothetical protein